VPDIKHVHNIYYPGTDSWEYGPESMKISHAELKDLMAFGDAPFVPNSVGFGMAQDNEKKEVAPQHRARGPRPNLAQLDAIETLKTQKLRGVLNLDAMQKGPLQNSQTIMAWPYCTMQEIHRQLTHRPDGLFARPCPSRPRHGFVESRIVKTLDEARTIILESIEEDSDAEVIFATPINATWSAILNPNQITFGRGNDGATGLGESATLAVAMDKVTEAGFRAGLDHETATPFVELVGNGYQYAVQLREGPGIPLASNFIPRNIEIKNDDEIITMGEEDGNRFSSMISNRGLLLWEKHLIKNHTPESVVWLPKQNLSSHWAVHAIALGIPVITDRKRPAIGQTFKQGNAVRWRPHNRKSLAHYLTHFLDAAITLEDAGEIVAIGAAAAHAAGAIQPINDRTPLLLAFASAFLWRLGVAACLGEMRHYYTCGPGILNSIKENGRHTAEPGPAHNLEGMEKAIPSPFKTAHEKITQGILKMRNENLPRLTRDQVYEEALILSSDRLRSFSIPLIAAFAYNEANCRWSGSYGGNRWKSCAKACFNLITAIDALIEKPIAKNYAPVIMALNFLVNVCHNNSRLLGKFCVSHPWSSISARPTLHLCAEITANLMLDGVKAFPQIPKG